MRQTEVVPFAEGEVIPGVGPIESVDIGVLEVGGIAIRTSEHALDHVAR